MIFYPVQAPKTYPLPTPDNNLLAMLFDYALQSHTRLLTPRSTNRLVEVNGIEPMTSCLQSTRSPN